MFRPAIGHLQVSLSLLRGNIYWGWVKEQRSLLDYHPLFCYCGGETRIIIKWIFVKLNGKAWTGLIWLKIGTGGGLL
jgi:hypothetical protein